MIASIEWLQQEHNYVRTGDAPEMFQEIVQKTKRNKAKGRRLISVTSFAEGIQEMMKHKPCPVFNFQFSGESRIGLETELQIKCECGFCVTILTNDKKSALDANKAFNWGCHASAVGYEAASTLFATLEVPVSCDQAFRKEQEQTLTAFENAACKTCLEAIEEEIRIATSMGSFINVEGVTYPNVPVKVDGGWSKRSYGHSFNANCGVGVVIGVRSGKVLFQEVRLRDCLICDKATDEGVDPKDHECHKNWEGPSTGMESDTLQSIFRKSREYGLVLGTFVGDGDSNVYKKLKNVYPGIEVSKVECKNHLTKNLRKKLINLSGDTSIPQFQRALPGLKSGFEESMKTIERCIRYYSTMDEFSHEDWPQLQFDINNALAHSFGDHSQCKAYYCDDTQQPQRRHHVRNYSNYTIWTKASEIIHNFAANSRSLIHNMNTNAAETFMSVVNKFSEGKRKNMGQRGLYKLRAYCAILSYNTTTFIIPAVFENEYPSVKEIPELWSKKLAASINARARIRKKNKKSFPQFRFLKEKIGDSNYGSLPDAPDMPEEILKLQIAALRRSLTVSKAQQEEKELATRTQSKCPEWFAERKYRITGSVAGEILALRDTTDSTRILNKILGRKTVRTKAMIYGIEQEDEARLDYVAYMKYKPGTVRTCGIIISTENGIFAVSPDGLVGSDGIVEIKCPYSLENDDPKKWAHIRSGKMTKLKKSSMYYSQVVMLLHVTSRKWVDFVVWTRGGIYVERIERSDETLNHWKKIVEKCERFWNDELAPEIENSRWDRGLEYRVPSYRIVKKRTSAQENDDSETPAPPPSSSSSEPMTSGTNVIQTTAKGNAKETSKKKPPKAKSKTTLAINAKLLSVAKRGSRRGKKEK